jgi:hypothetical protein
MTGDEVLAIGDEASRELGPGWTVCPAPNPAGVYLRHDDGRQLFVWQDHRDRSAGRLRVQGSYPGGWHCSPNDPPVITVRASRGGVALAGEIRRRMLPEYEAALAFARGRYELVAAIPGGARSAAESNGKVSVDLPGIFRRADVSPDGSEVSLKLPWLPAGEALRVIEALYGVRRPESLPGMPAAVSGPARRPESLPRGRPARRPAGRLAKVRQAGLWVLFTALTWTNKLP